MFGPPFEQAKKARRADGAASMSNQPLETNRDCCATLHQLERLTVLVMSWTSEDRLAKCPYGQEKPTCAKCPIHCYKKEKREHVRQVMRYAGPRMPLRHPWRALTHVFDKLRRVVHPKELRRARNRNRAPK